MGEYGVTFTILLRDWTLEQITLAAFAMAERKTTLWSSIGDAVSTVLGKGPPRTPTIPGEDLMAQVNATM